MSEPLGAAEPRGSAAIGAIVTGALALQAASTIMHTLVPLRLALDDRAPLLIGIIGSAYSIGFLVGCFAIPTLIRRIGHIRSFAVLAALQSALTATFELTPPEVWIASRLLMGFAGAGLGICIESWISAQARSSHRGRIFGLYQILNRLALIGSQVGVGFVGILDSNLLLVASAAFSIALVPVGLTHAQAPKTTNVVSVRLITLWQQAPMAVVGCLYVGLMGGPLTNVTPAFAILVGQSQQSAALLTAAVQAGALLLQYPIGWLADRTDSRLVMLCAALVTTVAAIVLSTLLLSGSTTDALWLYALFPLVGCAISIYTVAVTHAYTRLGPDRAVGLSAGLLFLWGIGATVGPVLAALIMQIADPRAFLHYIALLSAAVVVYVAVRMVREPGRDKQAAANRAGSES